MHQPVVEILSLLNPFADKLIRKPTINEMQDNAGARTTIYVIFIGGFLWIFIMAFSTSDTLSDREYLQHLADPAFRRKLGFFSRGKWFRELQFYSTEVVPSHRLHNASQRGSCGWCQHRMDCDNVLTQESKERYDRWGAILSRLPTTLLNRHLQMLHWCRLFFYLRYGSLLSLLITIIFYCGFRFIEWVSWTRSVQFAPTGVLFGAVLLGAYAVIGWFNSGRPNRRGVWGQLHYSVDAIFDAPEWNQWYTDAVCAHAGGKKVFEPMEIGPKDFSVSATALLHVIDTIVLRKLQSLCSGTNPAGDDLLLTNILMAFEEYYLLCYHTTCKISAQLLIAGDDQLVVIAPVDLPEARIDLSDNCLITKAFVSQKPVSGFDDFCRSLSLPFKNPGSIIAYPLNVPEEIRESAREIGIELASCLGVVVAVSDQRGMFTEENLSRNIPIVRPFATRLVYELVCAEYVRIRIQEKA